MNTLYDGESWKWYLNDLRFEAVNPSTRPTYNDLFNDSNSRVCRSLSEVYCLQTFRKDFENLPEFQSRKLKIAAIEGFRLKESDILGFKRSANAQENFDANLDIQGALINNPNQVSAVLDNILTKTVQKGHHDSLIGIDVDKYLIEEFREVLFSFKELNHEVKVENLS
jgi:hypothetical protein